MVACITSHPLPRLAVLTLIALTTYPRFTVSADFSSQDNAVPAANLDQQFVFALLTPMSRLVQSPYADPGAVDNPLRLSERSPVASVVHAVLSKPISAPASRQGVEILKSDVKGSASGIQVTPPEVSEGALPALGELQSGAAPLTLKTALAMTGR